MKLILCTLAVCLSILASVLTTQELIRAEGKRVRSAIPKALSEPLDPNGAKESVVQKLDAISTHLASLNRRLTLLEEAAGHPVGKLASEAPPAPAQTDFRTLNASVRALSDSLARLEGVPNHLAELTTYLDQSFEHLEKTVAETSAPEELFVSLDWMVRKIDDIDSYFTPLYTFLGLAYDPANQDLLEEYPSIDMRLNELFAEIENVRKAVADIRSNMIAPVVIEPTKRPR